jgi:uncharacterized repeat protein (TIGR01451 family)
MLLKRRVWLVCISTVLLAFVDADAALSVSVEMGPDRVRPGEAVNAQITVANSGGAVVHGVALQVPVPVGVDTFTALLLSNGATCTQNVVPNGLCDPGETMNWNLATIPAGASATVSLAMPVGAAVAGGTSIDLNATLQPGALVASAGVTVSTSNALTLAVDEFQDPIPAGALLTYTLTYGNRGSSNVNGTALSFPLPAGTTFVSASGAGSFAAGSVQWTLGDLAPTQSDQQQVVVAVDGGLPAGSVLEVDAALLSGASPAAETARAKAVTTVSTPLLGLAVDVNPDPARPGESSIAELKVTNRTAADLTGVELQMRIPQGLSPFNAYLTAGLSDNPVGPGMDCTQAIPDGLCNSLELSRYLLSTIPAGGSVTMSIPLPVAATTAPGRVLTLEAAVVELGSHQTLAEQSLAVDGDNALNLALDADANPVRAGGVLKYTLTYGNRSTASISGTSLSFPVPAGTSFLSATEGGTLSSGRVEWALGSLPASQSDQRQVVVAIDGGLAAGSPLLVDAALLSGTGAAGLHESARATAATSVTASTVLGLAVAVRPDPVRAGEWAFAEVTVTNRTLASLSPVVLQVRMPQGLSPFSGALFTGFAFTSPSCSPGALDNSLCDSSELASWNLGTLPPGESRAVNLALPVSAATEAGRLLNLEARVIEAAAAYDSTHQSSVHGTLAVDTDSPLTLAVDQDSAPVVAGSLLTYTLTYGNRGSSTLTGTSLSFPLPAQGVIAGSTGGTVRNGTLDWSLGSVAAGAGGRRKVFVNVPAGVPAGSILLVDEAVLRATAPATETARASSATAVDSSKPLGLKVSFGRDPTQPGAALTGSLSVTNNTAASLLVGVVQARVPLLVSAFNPAVLGGGFCLLSGIVADGLCDPVEEAIWPSPGFLAAGATIALPMPMTVLASGVTNGQLTYLDARIHDSLGRPLSAQLRTALVTPFVDGDADTVADIYDDCPVFANPTQVDTDLDGRGDGCECTDQNGDGRNTVSDLVAINVAIFNPGLATPLCDGDNSGTCDVSDILAANVEVFSPTSTSTCARHPDPGP